MSNLNLNKVVLCGKLTADVELKKTTNGKSVCSLTLAINRRPYLDNNGHKVVEADFPNCVVWGKTAEIIATYFKKGSSLCITGAILTRSWEKDGQKHYVTEINVDEAMFVDSKSDKKQDAAAYVPEAYGSPTFTSGANVPNFEEIPIDEDLPC